MTPHGADGRILGNIKWRRALHHLLPYFGAVIKDILVGSLFIDKLFSIVDIDSLLGLHFGMSADAVQGKKGETFAAAK